MHSSVVLFGLCQSCELLGRWLWELKSPEQLAREPFSSSRYAEWLCGLAALQPFPACSCPALSCPRWPGTYPITSYQVPSVPCVCHPPTRTSSRAPRVGSLAGAIPDQTKVSSHLVPAAQHWPEPFPFHWPCPAPSMPLVILQMPPLAFIPSLLQQLYSPRQQPYLIP